MQKREATALWYQQLVAVAQVKLLVLEVVPISEHLDTKHIDMEKLWYCPCQLRAEKAWEDNGKPLLPPGQFLC